ncbi:MULTISPECIES: SDR family NAD(P)-dependent oxidoreductase [Micromonospora]|uniref:3-oxoacyl-ACP reductase n=1 Tax=Micromonospora chalcea TaxID=1874 RepID=A0ABX9XX05_MICCH|nr:MULTISPECIES: glucose 1-dehydrogenase [Micromonospora]EWM66166.1 levodione reductase [Micromonospora sp. M42]MBC8990390.1 glucose 1-dehydrogenase [Micromonospora chalcea]MBP1780745.1 NAD(P)-dependent dehydrogenase (short-subunit alcohol dehydrogenase family) [Micromonospora sp. HB375]MBQ1060952.1 glucose 1-dehydrogenase [Micromonospora sp. C41]MBQ1070698.1 glucose 1-dehydrogenase [Micromonospora sp. D75]
MRFRDRVVLVTGGASGLGEATARRFAAEGGKLVIADINTEGAERVASSLPDALAVTMDTGDATSVERGIAEAVARYGRLDVIFNNAGIDGQQQALHEMDLANWEKVRRINGDGVFYVLRYGIDAMLRSGGGAIVNTSSTAGLTAQDNISPYTFTKAGIVGLTRSAAVEYAARGVRVNAVAPTVVMTPLVEHFIANAPDPEQMRRQMESFNPKPGIPTADDVAGVVLFLASDDAAWVTGHTIPIDGGYVAR